MFIPIPTLDTPILSTCLALKHVVRVTFLRFESMIANRAYKQFGNKTNVISTKIKIFYDVLDIIIVKEDRDKT